jgi:hypothetical protein
MEAYFAKDDRWWPTHFDFKLEAAKNVTPLWTQIITESEQAETLYFTSWFNLLAFASYSAHAAVYLNIAQPLRKGSQRVARPQRAGSETSKQRFTTLYMFFR